MDSLKRGIKRKRYEPPQEDLGVRISGKLHHNLKDVRKAAKKAKIFETQKLLKKLKGLRQKGEDVDEITESEAQLEALRITDHEAVANTALKTKLNKDRTLSENQFIQSAISKELVTNLLAPPLGIPSTKVQSRLLSSKVLAVEVATVVENLRNILQPKSHLGNVTEGVNHEDSEILTELVHKQPKYKEFYTLSSNNMGEHAGNLEETWMGIEESNEAGWESGTVMDDDELGGGLESDSLTGEPDVSGDELYDSKSESNDEAKEDDPPEILAKKPEVTKMKAPSKATGLKSTFIPSLSVGFTRGGSDDSGLSDSEVRAADIDIKKNRRGQRARRAIWEKKYGRNANHKKKELESRGPLRRGIEHQSINQKLGRSRDGHRPSKSQTEHKTNKFSLQRQVVDSGWSQRTNGIRAPPSKAVTTAKTACEEEKSIHPSWEAKKKLKIKEGAGIVPSEGKKIKFS